MGTRAFRGAGVQTPNGGKLETAWLFGCETQLTESPPEQKGCPLEWAQVSDHLVQSAINRFVKEMSVSTTTPNRRAVLSSRVDQSKGGCAQYCVI